MKNIISVMLFVVAFSINANAQQSGNETKKENCCAVQCDMTCCDDASCDMEAACCPMAADAGCAASATCADKASADSNAGAAATLVAAQPTASSCTAAGKPACCDSKEPARKA